LKEQRFSGYLLNFHHGQPQQNGLYHFTKIWTLGGNTANYDKTKEVANFKVKSEKLTEKIETLTFNMSDIADDSKTAKVQLAWENTSVKFTIGVEFDDRVMKDIEAKTKVSPGILLLLLQIII